MGCTLAIYDRETEYANRLMDYIKRKQKKLTVRVFTNPDSLGDYLEQNPVRILLINENLPLEEVKPDNIKNICLLSEDNDPSKQEEYPVIYKYQSAEILMKELFSHYPPQELQGRSKISPEPAAEIISVFSMDGDASRQVFAFSLANQYAALKRTLYVNLDIYPVLPELLGHKAEKGLTEFIYFLKQNHPNLMNKMNGIITKRNNLDYIEGVSFGPDLYELTTEDMNLWLNGIMLNTEYEIVIFDIGCYFQPIMDLLRNTGRLLLLSGGTTWEQVKYNNFLEQLNWAGYEDVAEKITLVPLTGEDMEKLQDLAANHFESETGSSDFTAQYMEL